MSKYTQNFKIQGRLLFIFGFIISSGVLIAGLTVFAITAMDRYAANIFTAEQNLNEAVKTTLLLKELELAELSYAISREPIYLHQHDRYLGRVDLFLRNSQIQAQSSQEKGILFEFEREKDAYEGRLEELAAAGQSGQWETAAEISLNSVENLEAMVDHLAQIVLIHRPIIDERIEQSNRQVVASAAAGLIALLFFLVAAFTAARVVNNQVIHPVNLLQQAAGALTTDTFDPELLRDLEKRTDEIGRLAHAFNRMAASIQVREERLKQEAADIQAKIDQTLHGERLA